MTRIRLLQAVCTVAMLTAAPAFAQTQVPTGATGPTGAPNPVDKPAATAPGNKSGADSTAMGSGHSMHHSGMRHSAGAMHAGAQDAAVDRLNDQSYQAAHQGQDYSGAGSASSTTKQ